MAVFGPDDAPIGSGGWDVDQFGNLVPKGTTLNSNPTATATPGSPGGPQLSTPQGGQVAVRPITTPDSSTGRPLSQAPSASSYEPSFQQGGQLTPSSRTGAPGLRVRTWFPTASSLAGDFSAMTGLGALAAPTMVGPTAFGGDTNTQMKDAAAADDADRNQFWDFWKHPFGQNAAPAPAVAPGSQTSPVTAPITQPGSGILPQARGSLPPPPTMTPPPPGGIIPPFPPPRPMAAIPPLPIGARAPVQHAGSPNLGYGVPGAQPAPASDPINPLPGHYRASVGNARGATWVPGGMDNPAPQIFRGPTTTYGAPNYGKGRSAARTIISQAPLPWEPGDWTGTGPVAGPLAAFAGNNPQSTSSGGRGGGQFQMPASASAPARAPMIQPQGTHFGSTARRVFGNPAMWQYPNVQM